MRILKPVRMRSKFGRSLPGAFRGPGAPVLAVLRINGQFFAVVPATKAKKARWRAEAIDAWRYMALIFVFSMGSKPGEH